MGFCAGYIRKIKEEETDQLFNQRNQMPFAQFLRIQTKAGGVSASNRKLIKTIRSMLSKKGKSFESKEFRKDLFRQVIAIQKRQRKLLK